MSVQAPSLRPSFRDVLLNGSTDCIVNYVWINDKPFIAGTGENDPQCGIPLHYVDRTIENAQRYPQAQFRIWIDQKLLEDSATLFFLQSHLYMSDCKNITIHDLNDITAYAGSDYLTDSQNPIWLRVDLARLVVMQHSLSENQEMISVYSDFDVEDLKLSSATFRSAIDHYGMVIGTPAPRELNKIENGFFAFRQEGQRAFSNIMNNTQVRITPGLTDHNALYSVFRRAIENHFHELGQQLSGALIRNVAYSSTVFPQKEEYKGLSISMR